MDNIKTLLQNSIFSALNDSDLDSLITNMQSRRYAEGEWLVQQGDVWPHLFLLKSGEVIAVKESFEGRSLILADFRAGDIFWGLAFFLEDNPMPASLQASQDSEILIWKREELLPLLLRNGSLSWELSRLMIRRVQLASDIVDQLEKLAKITRWECFLTCRSCTGLSDGRATLDQTVFWGWPCLLGMHRGECRHNGEPSREQPEDASEKS